MSKFPDDQGVHVSGQDKYTNVSYRQNATFFQRVKTSFAAIIIGLVFIWLASVLLFWNEGRAAQTAKSLDEGLRVLVHLESTDLAFENNNGRLVHLQGQLQTEKSLFDAAYKMSVKAARFRRTVEMYQWVEHDQNQEINKGGHTRQETEYSYSQAWCQELIDSNYFYSMVGHENPKSMSVHSEQQDASLVKLGTFRLSTALVSQIRDFRVIPPGTSASPKDSSLSYYDDYFYHSSPHNPKVGDIRIKFEAAGVLPDSDTGPPTDVSIVGRQSDSNLEGYQTEAGDELEILYTGLLSSKEIFSKKHADNILITWSIRFIGQLLMFVGVSYLTSIITTLVDWIPLVRDLVAVGVASFNAALSVSLSLTIIALGWIRYRPWLCCFILLLAAAPYLLARIQMFNLPANTQYRRR